MLPPTFIRRRRRQGLTLIELVVVVAVLAILAGFIVPRLGFVRNLAAESANATIISDSASQAVFYNTAVGHYPTGEDSLLDTANAVYANLNSGLSAILTPLDLSTDNNAAKSIVGQLDPKTTSVTLYAGTAGGSPTSTPNTDFTTAETLTYSKTAGGAGHVAQVTLPTSLTSASYPIYQAAYGSGALNTTTGAPLDGTYLIAFGYGSNIQINGKTGLEPPVLFDKTPGEYTRPILLLKVFPTGETAVGVPAGTSATTSISIGFDATTANNQLAKYAVDQNR
jgi:prepilin-type N-terminal cleavage/methylation domain-containing protein